MRQNDILVLAIITLIVALAWVLFDAYHAYTTSTIAPALTEISLPVTPTIDRAVIDRLRARHAPTAFQPVVPFEAGRSVPTTASASSVKGGTKSNGF